MRVDAYFVYRCCCARGQQTIHVRNTIHTTDQNPGQASTTSTHYNTQHLGMLSSSWESEAKNAEFHWLAKSRRLIRKKTVHCSAPENCGATDRLVASLPLVLSLDLPDPSGYPEFQFFLVPAGEVEGEVPVHNEPIVTVTDHLVVSADAPGHALPRHFTTAASNLEAIPERSRLIFVPHESEEGHVSWLGS